MKIKYANYILRTDNIGDNAQTYALDFIYRQMDIPPEDIVYFDRENVLEIVEDNCHYILPLVTADTLYFDLIEYLEEHHLENRFTFIPLSIGQTRWTFVDEAHLAKFRHIIDQFEMPIGCRDYDSASMYENLGYSTYVNGCITNTLPKRGKGEYDKVYLIDVPPLILQYIPPELMSKAVVLTQVCDLHLTIEQRRKGTAERYELLRDTASLVITCRYHVTTPCFAMGIPVIMVENCDKNHHWTFDPRFPALNPHIPFYTKEQFSDIRFSPEENSPADFESIKSTMVGLAISRIKHAAYAVQATNQIDAFFVPSKKRFWNTFCANRHKIDCFGFMYYLENQLLSKINGNFSYYLYGLSDRYIAQKECILLDYIKRHYPNAEFLGFVDGKKTGTYFGKEVLTPDKMQIGESTYCLVAAYSANKFVEQLFEKNDFDKSHLWQMPEELLYYIYHL